MSGASATNTVQANPTTGPEPPTGWWVRLQTGRRGAVVAAGLAVLGALGAAWCMPRGPITRAGVVVSLIGAVLLGVAAGWVMRSRWAMLVAPLVFVAVVEVARIPVVGPSVDRPRLNLTVGVIAVIIGRGFGYLLTVAPMVLGAAVGAGIARRQAGERGRSTGWGRAGLYVRRAVAVVVAVAFAGMGFLLARPGNTAAIVGPTGQPVPGSIAELATVRLGGHDQKVLIRGRSAGAPVLLYLSGGPGQSDLGYTRAYMPTLENDVVFAVWDQRGSGTSYAALDPTSTWTLQQAASDTIQLSEYLRNRFHQSKIYLFGNSWGSTLGVLAAQRRPDLYAAFIGAGQMVSQRVSDEMIYRDVLAYAAQHHDQALAGRMRAWGPPPYRDIYANAFLIGYYDKIAPYQKTDWFEHHGPSGVDGNGAREYGTLDKVNKLKALFDMGAVMYPQLQGIDFRRDVRSLDVPVYLVMGAHELAARTIPARQWYDALRAPAKHWVTFENSGHIPQFEEFARFHDYLVTTVLPQTNGSSY
jgi:proline iminopeptidase